MTRYRLREPHVIDGGLREAGVTVGDGPGDIPFPYPPTPYMMALDAEGQTALDTVLANHFEGGADLPGFVQLAPIPEPAGPPVNKAVPYLEGSAGVGGLLTCTMGIWDNEPTDYTYVWSSGAASGNTYNVTESDAGTSITCTVTASNVLGSATAAPSNAIDIPAAPGATMAAHGPVPMTGSRPQTSTSSSNQTSTSTSASRSHHHPEGDLAPPPKSKGDK